MFRPDSRTMTPVPLAEGRPAGSLLQCWPPRQPDPKLTTEFSVGEQTQSVGNSPRQQVLSFDGSLNCQATPNTSCVLGLSRGFSMSALGQSLVNGSYRLGITNTPAPQWQVGTNIVFRTIQYGPAILCLGKNPGIHSAQRRLLGGQCPGVL